MIRGSILIACAALLLSLVAHFGLAAYLAPEDPPARERGGATAAALGNSFQDVAAGTQMPVTPDQVQEPEPPTAVVQAPDTPAPQAPAVPDTQTAQPIRQALAAPDAATTPSAQAAQTPAAAPAETQPVAPGAVVATAPVAAAPVIQALTPIAPAPALRLTPTAQAPVAVPNTSPAQTQPAAQAPDTLPALPEAAPTPAPILSARPTMRPRAIEQAGEARAAAQRQAAAQRRAEQAKPRPRQGAAQAEQRRGSDQGRQAGNATSGTAPKPSATRAGNAAAANYPGLVDRAISRVPRPSLRGPGVVTVSFSIAQNGRLAGVRVARSSGNPRLDQAAVRMIRRARFPRPPAGARTTFSKRIGWK